MPSNVEIKARVKDVAKLKEVARALSGEEAVVIHQQDTFFSVPEGRLKLRKLEVTRSLLIQITEIIDKQIHN